MLPANINDIAFTNVAEAQTIRALLANPTRFPSNAKNSILLWGRYGTGKTTFAHMLTALIEHAHASDKAKSCYDWQYRYRSTATSITHKNKGKECVEPLNVNFYNCGEIHNNSVPSIIEEVHEKCRRGFTAIADAGGQFNHFIFDEIDLWSDRSQAQLKGLITAAPSNNVFYSTTNFKDKVDGGLLSRSIGLQLNGATDDFYLNAIRATHPTLNHINDDSMVRIIKATGGDWRQIHDMMFRLETAA